MTGREAGGRKKVVVDPPKQKTRFLTNCFELGVELNKRCNVKESTPRSLVGADEAAVAETPNGVRAAATSAPEVDRHHKLLREAICKGVRRQIELDLRQVQCLMSVRHDTKIDSKQVQSLMSLRHVTEAKRDKGIKHDNEEEEMTAWDDVSGGILNPAQVKVARMKEIGYVRQKGVYSRMSRNEAYRKGIRVVDTRWLDINKGDDEHEDYRSRLVAKDFNVGKEAGLFAATPPLEAVKVFVSEAATLEDE